MRQDYLVTPSMIGAKGRMIYSQGQSDTRTFDDDHPIHVHVEHCGISKVCIWHVSPIWDITNSNGMTYALEGEFVNGGNVRSVSKQRIKSIIRDTNNTQIIITCKGVFQEPIRLVFGTPGNGPIIATCWTTETSDEAHFILNPYISCG